MLLDAALKELLRNSTDFTFVKDPDLIYRAASDTVAILGGFASGNELIGKTDYDIFPRNLADKYRDDDRRVMETRISIEGMTERLPDANGGARWVQTWKRALVDDAGDVVGIYGTSRDVTKTFELEAETATMRHYMDLIDNIPGGVAMLHYINGVVYLDYANDGFVRIHHISQQKKDAAVGHRVIDSVYEPDREAVIAECERVAADDGAMGSVDYRMRGEDNELYWVNVQFRFAYEDDVIRYYYASYTDVDRQRKSDDAEKERYLTEQSYIDSIADTYLAASRINITRNRVETVAGSDMVYGIGSYDDMQASIAAHILREHDRAAYIETFSRESLLEGFHRGTNNVSLDYYSMRSDGRPLWVRSSMSLVRQPGTGDIVGFASGADINIAKITEIIATEVLMDKYECVSYIRGTRNSGVTIRAEHVDTPSVMNDYVAEVEHYAHAHVVPEDRDGFISFCAVRNVFDELDSKGFCETMFWVDEGGCSRRKKLDFYCLDRENALLAFVREDVTDQYRQEIEREHQLEDALRAAEEASKAKSEFLSRMSHDIRTPLNGIIGMTRIAHDQTDLKSMEGCLDKIDTSSHFLLGLVNDILEISKVESGEVDLHPEPYGLDDFLDYLDAVIKPLCVRKGVALTVETDMVDGVLPLMDVLRSNQIASNLLSNAVKFMPKGGSVGFSVREKAIDESHLDMTVTVSDTGIGMSEEFQKRMFEPFAQEGQHVSLETSGTGLGLPIVRRLVDLMGGTITSTSALGKGTVFTVHGVLECVSAADFGKERERLHDADMDALSGRQVLLVEDHPLNTEIAVAMLEKAGIIVETAKDGKRAVDMFSASPEGYFDAVLMDIRMPVMDGYEATRSIRALDRVDARTVPIIAMTADVYAEDVRNTRTAGMNAHIAKPIDPEKLYATLARLCGRDASEVEQGNSEF